jgi:predicted butyrate kinase (DUF1464 family)
MALSIGVDCSTGQWKTCLRESGRALRLCSFVDLTTMLSYLERTCAFYPEPTIVLPADLAMPLTRLSKLTDQQLNELTSRLKRQQQDDLLQFLIALRTMSLDSYCLPAIRHLVSVPLHRKLNHIDIGGPDNLSIVSTLLYRMREREAAWSEMNFFLLDIDSRSRSIVVVEHGRIVNGISEIANDDLTDRSDIASFFADEAARRHAAEQAFWEGLTQELAGLMAIHHLEDIIVIGSRKDAFIERFGDTYQIYLYPSGEPDSESYEIAIGAAIIAEGLRYPSLAAEVVEQLEICHLA